MMPKPGKFTMPYEGSELFLGDDVPAVNIPTLRTAISVPPKARGAAAAVALDAAERELDQLRAINARLRRELAALQLREAEALRLADRDGLTGLYNRRRMFELLHTAITEAALQNHHVGLLFIDLNGFKAVNDFYGHAAGDRILTTVATRMSARVRTGDILCRYGGDEFVVVLPSLPDVSCLSRIAQAVAERIALPYWIRGQEQHLSAAVGEAIYLRDGVDADALLHVADQNMYNVKKGAAEPQAADASQTAPLHLLCRRRNDKI